MDRRMAAKKTKIATTPFDIAEYLTDDATIAAYLSAAAEDSDPNVLLAAIGDVAKARGMSGIARKSRLGRESLYKAFVAGAKPRHETVRAVLHAFGMKFVVVPEAVATNGPRHRKARKTPTAAALATA
jgi:probable addiction module antidote protein